MDLHAHGGRTYRRTGPASAANAYSLPRSHSDTRASKTAGSEPPWAQSRIGAPRPSGAKISASATRTQPEGHCDDETQWATRPICDARNICIEGPPVKSHLASPSSAQPFIGLIPLSNRLYTLGTDGPASRSCGGNASPRRMSTRALCFRVPSHGYFRIRSERSPPSVVPSSVHRPRGRCGSSMPGAVSCEPHPSARGSGASVKSDGPGPMMPGGGWRRGSTSVGMGTADDRLRRS